MNIDEFLRMLQLRTASTAVGPSTARRMGPSGTIETARAFLATVSLKKVADSGSSFPELLDELTDELKYSLPRGARNWGSARKFINIFLRDACYNHFLREAFNLGRIESRLEIPIDSQIAKKLREKNLKGESLRRWKSVISLKPKLNRKYQDIAACIAKEAGLCRVHLDVLYWRSQALERLKGAA